MSEGENHHHGKNEIIIVKRHGDHEGDHHSAAWKIAYADFMTAMMAFFLVMWLVNAANEKTQASVASYFNPIKLTDDKPADKSVKKPANSAEGEATQDKSKEQGQQQASGNGAESGKDEKTTAGEEAKYSEANFFENPYSVLSEIAQEVGQQANVSAKGEGGAATSGPATGANGGEAYRDPFDPDFWTQQVEISQATDAGSEGKTGQQMAAASDDTVKEALAKEEAEKAAAAKAEAEKAVAEAAKAKEDEKKTAEEKKADELKKQLAEQIGTLGKLAEGLSVTPAEGGLLVSLTDQLDTPMFNVGSAVPKREMVLAMEKIGKVLEGRPGAIAIRGHTDARPFAGGKNDNWKLSMDRAQSAYYMLVRGGLEEKRVSQVTGFADRRLKVPADPMADANRRIEILIQAEGG
ncbi:MULTISPECIES: MotB family protein [unclassified Shinella]|jgi:chemotaxis protein MotB|uniref:MotB family protein n=1 Tax=unclassified Shinella TaxID=2643062 RepID=UPI0003C54353|nr:MULTISPECIES: MotB family protein [unclassified Shinella]MCA0342376.1 MotB family protein [Pseudomonadota bacterium]EYR80384.1 flagellar motor protein [Shinella sp. DD12]KNY14834.1 flagellar motor protein MotB [Shinella sp. SUS2]KOC74487.1 flagellar motor protein MotB [Shinella sp. GWS1]MCO5152779.1 MotB family protein [Shinella sp.]